ncbi:MAG: hypothetical protein JNG85_08560, partial [Spirochaetaceae bacterium]|nr:hypothetical protein [Spirochaetaceae bacterium]
LVVAGAEDYKVRLVQKGDIDAIADVAKYFSTALRYDPRNQEAARYAALVEDFRAARLRKSVGEATALLKKAKRTEAEDFALVAASRRALRLDAGDDDAQRIFKETSEVRAKLVDVYLARADATLAKATPTAAAAVKEKAFVEAFKEVNKALAVEPKHFDANKTYGSLRSEISAIVKGRLAGVTPLVEKRSFSEARAQLLVVKDLDSKLEGAFSADIVGVEYDLYYHWAENLYAAKDYANASLRLDAALAAKRGSEAVALKKKIDDARSVAELGASFGAGLSNVDRYIAAGDLGRAQRVLAGLSKGSLDAARKRQLNDRRDAVRAALGEVYERGVRLYKEETFKEAIAAFETVIAVDPDYEEVASYLDKARAKQKLLDQF